MLSQNEEDTVTLLAKGMNIKKISKFLGETPHSTKMRMHRIYRKLNVKNANELIWKMIMEGGLALWQYDPIRRRTRINGHLKIKVD